MQELQDTNGRKLSNIINQVRVETTKQIRQQTIDEAEQIHAQIMNQTIKEAEKDMRKSRKTCKRNMKRRYRV